MCDELYARKRVYLYQTIDFQEWYLARLVFPSSDAAIGKVHLSKQLLYIQQYEDPYQNIIQSPFVQLPSALKKYLMNNERIGLYRVIRIYEKRCKILTKD
jgi:hypothetical protein